LMTTMRVVGECSSGTGSPGFSPDKFHRAVKRMCVCVCDLDQLVDLSHPVFGMVFLSIMTLLI